MSNKEKNKLLRELSNLIDAFEELENSSPDQVRKKDEQFVSKLAKFQQNLTLLKEAQDNDYENIESRVAIYSVPDFLTYIGRFSKTNNTLTKGIKKILEISSLFYRGNSKANLPLEPGLFREDKNYNIEEEATFLSALMAEKPLEFQQDKNNFERLSRIRHYNAPTRLLDVSSNPLIALYFAAKTENKKDGEVLTFFVNKNNVKYSNSDTVQCISSLSALNKRKKQKAIELLNEFNFEEKTQFFKQNKKEIKELQEEITEIIQRDQPGFKLRPQKANQLIEDLCTIWAVIPPKTNPRLIAQNGKFLIFGKNFHKNENPPKWNIQIASAVIPAPCKKSILKELQQLDINEATIYPELQKDTDYFTKKILMK